MIKDGFICYYNHVSLEADKFSLEIMYGFQICDFMNTK